MNVGYTPERALDLASRLRAASAELEAAAAVVECSRCSISAPGAAERRKLLAALDEYDRRREERGCGGPYGRGLVGRSLLGSVSTSVVHQAPRDVLVVR